MDPLTSNTLLAEALEFLKFEQNADVLAMKEWDDMTRGKLPFTEEDQAMKTFRNRSALIAKIESAADEKEAAHAESICERCDKPLSTHSLPLNRCADGERGIF